MKLPPHEPCLERRGMTDKNGKQRYCMECGRWAVFGFGVAMDKIGRWYCKEHRNLGDKA